MESFFPIIIIVIISIISSIIKKSKQQNQSGQPTKKITHFDKHGRPVRTTKVESQPTGGLADILKEFQKLKESTQSPVRQGFPTPQRESQTTFNNYPEQVEAQPEIYNREQIQESEQMSGSVSMEDRIAVRNNALTEYVDENHPIFKGAGRAAESRISNKKKSSFMTDFAKKENILRAIVMNEAIFNRKG